MLYLQNLQHLIDTSRTPSDQGTHCRKAVVGGQQQNKAKVVKKKTHRCVHHVICIFFLVEYLDSMPLLHLCEFSQILLLVSKDGREFLPHEDHFFWSLTPNGRFTTKSTYYLACKINNQSQSSNFKGFKIKLNWVWKTSYP
ncbi:hypothetical protein M9H77_29512 [Catharanthus roseus]|uniref:Uncharacterized protein n=1 Tax=Catharanthus roseus TaxID=4058 RepID=A0ACB9ZWH0_CATRO|nr:hypothetical protein M9H77_29512 [Catharanthus roseus]